MTLGIISATCSCEYDASNNCICAVSGTARIETAGNYIVIRAWWDGDDLRGDPLYAITINPGDPITFDYSGSFDNTEPDASSYIIYLAKSGVTGKIGQQLRITPEECTISPPPPVAEGELVEVNIPASVVQGTTYDVTAKVHNKGGATGTFVVRWYINTVLKSASGEFTLAAGATSVDKVQPTTPLTAPTTGTSMTYDLRLIRII